MNYDPIIKQRLIALFLVILLFYGVYFLFTHSVLVIQSNSESEKVVNVRHNDGAKDFKITKNAKVMLLPKGIYTIEVAENDKLTNYHRVLGAFWVHKINVELSDQKKAISLGSSRLNCAVSQKPSNRVMYYPCLPSTNNTLTATTDGVNTTDAFPVSTSVPAGGENSHDDLAKNGVSVHSYAGGFLTATSSGEKLTMLQQGEGAPISIELADFKGAISDNTFTVTKNGNMFAALDTIEGSLRIFQDINDKNPFKLDLSKEVNNDEGNETKILAGNNFIFMLNTKSLGDIEGDPNQEKDKSRADTQQGIIVIDVASKKVVARHKLPRDLFIREIAISPNGNLLYVPLSDKEGEIYTAKGKEGPELLGPIQSTIGSICWKNNDSFYYSADASNSIYLYSQQSNSSLLVYNNPKMFVSALRCEESGQLYFSASPSEDTASDKFRHFTLSEEAQTGSRLENLFPRYVGSDSNLGLATLFKDSIYVEASSGAPPKDQTAKTITNDLVEEGVKPESLRFKFLY